MASKFGLIVFSTGFHVYINELSGYDLTGAVLPAEAIGARGALDVSIHPSINSAIMMIDD